MLDEAGEVVNNDHIQIWKQKDVNARLSIYSAINSDQQLTLHGCQTASEMWTKIMTEYAEVAIENKHLLMAKFFAYKFQPGNIF